MKFIRCSMLPAYPDCPRRAAAKQFWPAIQNAGFQVRKLMPSAGAAVGTAVHSAVEHVLKCKIETGELGKVEEGIGIGIDKFREEIAPGAEWDDTTPNGKIAEMQIGRLARAYMMVAADIRPARVEMELRAALQEGWELTGHIDLYTEDGIVDDLKTGALKRPYQAQLGGYSLLCKSHGLPVSGVGTTYIGRCRASSPQTAPDCQNYDMEVSEQAAYHTIQRIIKDVQAFELSGDPHSFPANPMSLMCSNKYCPAWGTAFCKQHMTKESIKYDID